MDKSILQTQEWQKLQQDLGETTFFEQNQDFSYLAILKNTPTGNYLYTPYGPYTQTKNGFKKALKALEDLAKDQNAIFIRIEPQDTKNLDFLQKNTKIKKSHDLNPADTFIVPIENDEQIRSIVPKTTRNYYNTREKKGISVKCSKNPRDLKYLIDFQKKLAKTKNFEIYSKKYYETQLKQNFASLYLVYLNKKPIASALVFDSQDTRYYIQAASDPEYRKLAPNNILVAQILFDASAKGLKKFDFWGIAPDNAKKTHPWAGFTKFKKSFGGEAVHYCGTWDIVLNPTKYHLYQILRKINKIKRKLLK